MLLKISLIKEPNSIFSTRFLFTYTAAQDPERKMRLLCRRRLAVDGCAANLKLSRRHVTTSQITAFSHGCFRAEDIVDAEHQVCRALVWRLPTTLTLHGRGAVLVDAALHDRPWRELCLLGPRPPWTSFAWPRPPWASSPGGLISRGPHPPVASSSVGLVPRGPRLPRALSAVGRWDHRPA